MEAALFAVIAFVRLAEGGLAVFLAWRWRRWAVMLWGVATIALCIPVVTLALGHVIPPGAALAISCVHGIAGALVVAALLSSRGYGERMLTILRTAALDPDETGWRA